MSLTLIGVILFLQTTLSYGRIPDLKSRVYSPLLNYKDISFSITAKSLTDLINSKTNTQKQNIQLRAYFFNDKSAVSIDNLPNSLENIRSKMEDVLFQKTKIVRGLSLNNWLSEYNFIQASSGWFSYQDKTGMNDVGEIKVKFLNKSLKVIEKKPTGTLKTSYEYNITNWSKGLLVLDKIKREMYEGIQLVITENIVKYKKLEEVGYVPYLVDVKTTQRVSYNSKNIVERKLVEKYEFKDFLIDKKIAETWFKAKK